MSNSCRYLAGITQILNTTVSEYRPACWKTGGLVPCWWESKMVRPSFETVDSVLFVVLFCFVLFLETGFLCIALAVLELTF